jgi:hypothetical protein
MTPDRIEQIRQSPDLLDGLSGCEFEELVGEILASFSWKVRLTSQTRDGGYDILGISPDPSGLDTSWIVECKRYDRDRPVGVEVLRQLFGVKEGLRIPQAVLVTTSRLTRDAEQFVASVSSLQVVDRPRLLKWLGAYQMPIVGTLHIATREFQSCFISYSSKDEEFATRLHADLRNSGVHCWFAPEDLKIGDKLRPAFDDAIRIHDKLMVILSEHSVKSLWVEKEVETAFEKERQQNKIVLFPIRLDDAVMDTAEAWAADLRRTRYIGDFRQWKNDGAYKKAFERLLGDLKLEGKIKSAARDV